MKVGWECPDNNQVRGRGENSEHYGVHIEAKKKPEVRLFKDYLFY